MSRIKRMPNVDFVGHAPEEEGKEVNVNHENCPAGYDGKKRLYVKRVTGGIVAYCHHCGLAGYYVAGKSRLRPRKHVEVEATPEAPFELPKSRVMNIGSGVNYNWLFTKYLEGRSDQVIADVLLYVREVPEIDGCPLMYGIHDRESNTNGYQLRWTDGRSPKTKTHLKTKPNLGSWFGRPDATTLVLVEDPLSAVIISKTMLAAGTKVAVLCLFGTRLAPAIVPSLSGYHKIVVWTDNDSAGNKAADEIIKRLNYVYPSTLLYNLSSEVQPKEHRLIEEVLKPYV